VKELPSEIQYQFALLSFERDLFLMVVIDFLRISFLLIKDIYRYVAYLIADKGRHIFLLRR
jgi:hypothetical protein